MINEAFLALYEREFAAYNRVHNISRLRDIRAEAIDSLRALQIADFSSAQVADIGSGAGFPALFLAASVPSANFVLFEPNHKKAAFLTMIVIKSGLKNVSVQAKKVQDYAATATASTATATATARGAVGSAGRKISAASSPKSPLAPLVKFDFITSRAFAPALKIAELCAPLCSLKTRFLLYKGEQVNAELDALSRYFLHKFEQRIILDFSASDLK